VAARAPVLVFGYGNPSRGDDALGPEFVRRLEAERALEVASGALELLTDFQLQVEHALDLQGRTRVYFVDATAEGGAPAFEVRPVRAARDGTFSTHLLSPEAVLHTCQEVLGEPAPEAFVIAIRGERFELGEALSATAERNLALALAAFPANGGEGPSIRGAD
jgi:hydrogenase maturation protease